MAARSIWMAAKRPSKSKGMRHLSASGPKGAEHTQMARGIFGEVHAPAKND
jgi:hypothetical protein